MDERDLDEFESLVADAIDALPEEFQRLLESVAVVVSDLGTEHQAYGECTSATGWGARASKTGS